MFTDTHCHLSFPEFDADRAEVLVRARLLGVKKIINVSCDIESFQKACELFANEENIYLTIGIHPEEASLDQLGQLSKLRQLGQQIQEGKIVAVGEIGLDFFHQPYDEKLQRDLFRAQLELAQEVDLPVIVHSRAAEKETLALIKEIGVKRGVMHCFTGDEETAKEILAYGFHISFPGPITYPKNENLRNILKQIPLERLLLETDAPYLSPQEFRGKRNEPAYLSSTASFIANFLGRGVVEIAEITSRNASTLFNLK